MKKHLPTCTVHTFSGLAKFSAKEREADARLIAAAPDLLIQLIEMAASVEAKADTGRRRAMTVSPRMERALEAAKALIEAL